MVSPRMICWLALLACCLTLRAVVGDEAVPVGSQKGVLLLRNGEVISGTIAPAGDRFDVRVGDGEVRIKRTDVELVAQDVAECYVHRRRGVETGRVQDHLQLADWCLRHNLLAEAANEIESARQADDRHPKIVLLQRRLELAKEQPAQQRSEPVEKPAGVSGDQLDRMVRDLPSRSVETFTNTIQPLLLNRCATAACHGPQSTSAFHLTRVPPNRPVSRRTTQRNLFATLSNVNGQQPEDSPLLTTPLAAHGSSKGPIFPSRESAQYKQLANWVAQLNGKSPTLNQEVPPVAHEEPIDEQVPDVPTAASQLTAAQRANRNRLQKPASRTRPDSPTMVISESEAQPVELPNAKRQNDNQKSTQDAAARKPGLQKVPAKVSLPEPAADDDPLDPEIFNRRFADQQ